MYGDFSRNPFSQKYRITRVLFNQGQPLIEADLNEALYSVIENQRYIKDKVTGTIVEGSKVKGKIESPIGGMEIPCEIQITSEGNANTLTVSQHPFSLVYLSKRLSDRRLIHAVEMWGLRLAFREGGGDSPPPAITGTFKANKKIPEDWMIRVEVHSVKVGKITFKIDTHNAGYANACKVNGKELRLDAGSCFVRPIRSEEFVELQVPSSDFILPSSDDSYIVRVLSDADEVGQRYTIESALEAEVDKQITQCRFWKWRSEYVGNEILTELKGIWNTQFTFVLHCNISALMAGMFWLIDAKELNAALEKDSEANPRPDAPGSVCVASQHPQFVYNASLTPIQSASTSAPANTRGLATPSGPVAPSEPAPPAATNMPTTGNNPTTIAHLRDLPCGRLASGTSTPVIRRWLASMTLGELEGLDAEQVRSRLVRDCNLRLDDLPNIDDEIGRLVALRDQYFGSPRSALA